MQVQLVGVSAMVAVMAAFGPSMAVAEEDPPVFSLVLRNHKFEPAEIIVPAGKRLVLKVRNADSTPAEFESRELNVERVITAGRESTIRVGPLTPGNYPFMDDFNQSARGVLIAKE